MKKTLLFTILLATQLMVAQSPISDFFSVPNSTYAIVEDDALDESAAGADVTWDFTNLTAIGTNTDTYTTPTSGELVTYPGTTEVLTITTLGGGDNKIFAKDITGAFSLTGAGGGGVDLNYDTDNAIIGTFPLSYGDSSSDAVAGSFTGQGITGTFTGTIT